MTIDEARQQAKDRVLGMADHCPGLQLNGDSQLVGYISSLAHYARDRGKMALYNSLISFSGNRTDKARRQLLRDNADAIAEAGIYKGT